MTDNATTKLDQLTSLRFFAAFMIVLHHAQGLFGIDLHGVNLGQGVSFFFVLSGFILSYVYPELKGWSAVKRFWRARIARLWPGFFVSFLLGFFLLKQTWETKTALAYLLLLQSWLPLSSFYFSYNAAAWSISTELFFYLAFPLLIWRWPQSWHWKLALSAALLAAVVLTVRFFGLPDYGNPSEGQQGMLVTQHGLIYISPLSRIFEFVFGMCVAWAWRAKRVTWTRATATAFEVAAIVACIISVYEMGTLAETVRRSVIGSTGAIWVMHCGSMFTFGALIYIMAYGRGVLSKILSKHAFVVLGEISFSLYLIHQILLSYYRGHMPEFLSLPAAPAFAAYLVILLASSYLLWVLVEIPGRNLLLGRKPIHGSAQMQQDWQSDAGTRRNAGMAGLALSFTVVLCLWPSMSQVGFAGLIADQQGTFLLLLFIVPMISLQQNKIWQRVKAPNVLLAVVAALVFVYAAYIAIRYASQIPMDYYSFRQTQTALTSLWFVKEGFQLAYQTPVGGAPWSIPFEFPLYQYIVALASQATPLSLDACGRLVSFVFLALCLVPARTIVRQLGLSSATWLVFAALLLSSPLYLYWGRTFMIETTAVFFAIAAIRYFIDLLQGRATVVTTTLFLLCMTLSILQKSTTGMMVLAILGLCYFFSSLAALKSNKAQAGAFVSKRTAIAALYVGVPLAIGVIWTIYTDHVKALNPLGAHMTASALPSWYWGTLSQRLSSKLFVEVIWGRIFQQNLGGVIGLAVLVFAAYSSAKNNIKLVVLAAVAMGVVPIFLFTNLHIVHTYYQSANVIFLIFALSVGVGHIVAQSFGRTDLLIVLLLALVSSNYYWYDKVYSGVVKVDFKKENSRDVAVAAILKRELPEGKAFVAYGNDWSSSLAYLAERKSFTVPAFMENYVQRAANPENFIAAADLGGIVLCPDGAPPTLNELFQWANTHGHWKFAETQGCVIVLPEQPVPAESVAPAAQCEGSLDVVAVVPGRDALNVAGWTTVSAVRGVIPERTYVTLRKEGDLTAYFQALQVSRPDVNQAFKRPDMADPGFSRIIDASKLSGSYTVGVARVQQGHLEQCQFQTPVTIHKDAYVSK